VAAAVSVAVAAVPVVAAVVLPLRVVVSLFVLTLRARPVVVGSLAL
jgi:hypothetical protein